MTVHEEQWVWHRRLGHISMRKLSQLNKLELVRGLPKLKFSSDALCEACQKGKFSKTSFISTKFCFKERMDWQYCLYKTQHTWGVNSLTSGPSLSRNRIGSFHIHC